MLDLDDHRALARHRKPRPVSRRRVMTFEQGDARVIQLFKPDIGDDEIAAVTRSCVSGWLGLGPKTAEFEKRFAAYVGTKAAVGVNSGTSALDLALRLLRISHNDEVIVPTFTFVSTAHVVAYNLATPVFADVDPRIPSTSLWTT